MNQVLDMLSLRKAIESEGYIFDEDFLVTLHIALQLGKPLLIEGDAGVGKTEVAKVVSAVMEIPLLRLQCYEGLDESKALYEWNYRKQLLALQQLREIEGPVSEKEHFSRLPELFSEEFLLERPLLRAIRSKTRTVLLIDEIDKADEEFEAFLLEVLSDFQISIPELGTLKAVRIPVVILTSNNSRQLTEALKRRCVYMHLNYPDVEKEMRIIRSRLPGTPERLIRDVARGIACLRANEHIYKKPSIAETLDWVAALTAMGRERLDQKSLQETLGFILKNREDIEEVQKEGAIDAILSGKSC
ncbi:MAG TPA: ATPase [Clostridiales bacterium]|nr:ATPase [Clostridiales bacterium]